MNAQRRKEIARIAKELENIKDRIEELRGELEVGVKSDEESYLEAMPDGLRDGEKGAKAQAAIDNLDSAIDTLGGIENTVDDAINDLNEAAE